jgi:hypothetical protein
MNGQKYGIFLTGQSVEERVLMALFSTAQEMLRLNKNGAKGADKSQKLLFLIETEFKYTTIGPVSGYLFYADLVHDGKAASVIFLANRVSKNIRLVWGEDRVGDLIRLVTLN